MNFEINIVKKDNNNNKKLPKPFLKWAGGKRQLIPQMINYFPKNFFTYIEPFIGGGAIFFYLYCNNLLANKKVVIFDINEDLINSYNVIKTHVMDLIESLKIHKNEKEYFYKVREQDRDPAIYDNLTDIEKASRIIYLNRCCYNGLYRVNSKGYFNVPFGKYKNPNFCDEENLIAVNKALKNVKILNNSFEKCIEFADKGDFIYFDPPYFPISETSSFTSYTKDNFGKEAQISLSKAFIKLDKIECNLMLSNSNNIFIRNLYKDFNITELLAKRVINSNRNKRGRIKELLITNDF